MLIKYCVFSKILKYSGLLPFPRCQCVYTHQAGRKPALQQNWQSSEKSQNFKEKNTISNEHPVYRQKLTTLISVTTLVGRSMHVRRPPRYRLFAPYLGFILIRIRSFCAWIRCISRRTEETDSRFSDLNDVTS